MKLSSLFAKYLYQHKQLRLPGIGIFSIDPSIPVPDSNDKNFAEYIQNIRYQPQQVSAPDEEFINFIRTETGKIKPLAESDLDSFLSDGKILLNIGKPFHFEGIGYLQKNKEGAYEFKAGDPTLQKFETHTQESDHSSTKEKPFFLDSGSQQTGVKRIMIAVGAIAGIILVIWLGYILYDRNTTSAPAPVQNDVVVPEENTRANIINDSAKNIIQNSANEIARSSQPGTYKFIIERTANKARALRRFNQLKENLADVKMESADSTLFKLYFVIPALPSDTARIRDSLKIWYGRRQVFVEN